MTTAIIVILYLIVLFGACAWAQQQEKKRIAAGAQGSFLMAGKNLSLIIIVMLCAGGSIGGATTTGIAQLVQTAGVSSIWYGAANVIGLLFLGIVGAKRIRRLGYSTNAEMVADYCGSAARYLMTIGQLIIILGVGCLQYVTGGAMLSTMFPGTISFNAGIAITAMAFAVICILGGLYGTGLANVINVIVIYVSLFVCLFVALAKYGSISEISAQINQLQQATIAGGPWLTLTGGLGLLTCLSYLVSEPGNRITTQSNTMCAHAAKSEKTASWGIIVGALLCLPICIISVIFGLIAKVNFPDIPSAQAMSRVIMSLGPVLSGIGMAGLWAVTVSTGVALLMSAAQLVGFDVLAPLKKNWLSTPKTEALTSRVSLIIMVGVTLFLAYRATSIVGTIITVLCITPAFFWMMLSFLYWPRLIKKSSAIVTQVVAYIFFCAWLFIPNVKAVFPTPIYVEWPICTVVWFLCYFVDKRPIDNVMPKMERLIAANSKGGKEGEGPFGPILSAIIP
ncbi:MAG: sodium:solute symporter family protein [Treponema sp.]|jgi:SSS family solute:Na+ symporter|nr:sodium:solute symporter family protein [Treponema sp.]